MLRKVLNQELMFPGYITNATEAEGIQIHYRKELRQYIKKYN